MNAEKSILCEKTLRPLRYPRLFLLATPYGGTTYESIEVNQ